MGRPPIPRPGNAVRERAWWIGVGSQASDVPRTDEVQGIEIAKKNERCPLVGGLQSGIMQRRRAAAAKESASCPSIFSRFY